MRKGTFLAALAVSAAMIAGACGSSSSSGSTLLFGDYQDVDSLGPYWGTVMAANVISTTEVGLTKLNGKMEMEPNLAVKIPTVGELLRIEVG